MNDAAPAEVCCKYNQEEFVSTDPPAVGNHIFFGMEGAEECVEISLIGAGESTEKETHLLRAICAKFSCHIIRGAIRINKR